MQRVLRVLATTIAVFSASMPLGFANGSIENSSDCDSKIQQRQAFETDQQLAWYFAHGKTFPSFDRLSRFHRGTTGNAVLVLHGFISSPKEIEEVSSFLIGRGDTVLVPLITGFGANAETANASRIEDWQLSVDRALANLHQCYPSVSIVAHSLGGALALDAVLNRGATGLSAIALLAPYTRTYYPGINILNDIIKAGTDKIDLRLLELLLRMQPSRVLPIPMPLPGAPDDDPNLPLQAIESALDLQKKFSTGTVSVESEIPLFTAFSENDFVIDGRFASEFLNTRFSSVETLYFDSSIGVSHYMHRKAANPRHQELMLSIGRFLDRSERN